MKKLLTRLFIAMLILTFTPTMNTQAKAKIKLNKTKISLQRGKTYTLEENWRNKEKSKVVKQQENDRYCNKKRKSYSQKARNSSDHSQDRKEEIQM
jgi:hypothetical protein